MKEKTPKKIEKEIKSIDDLYRNPNLFYFTLCACMLAFIVVFIEEFEVKERINERENTKKD